MLFFGGRSLPINSCEWNIENWIWGVNNINPLHPVTGGRFYALRLSLALVPELELGCPLCVFWEKKADDGIK
jgi:hypothetical protein